METTQTIHPSAVIDEGARIALDVEIGPGCYIEGGVTLGPGCRLIHSVTLLGNTRIGARNVFHPYSVIGGEPQDFKYRGENSLTIIGDDNVFRENVTVNRGTEVASNQTVIGNRNYIMACSHVAHDSVLEDECVLANQALLAGHVRVQTGTTISGQVGIHHFVTVGKFSFVGGCSRITQDVPPFMIVQGMTGDVHGINSVGLRRRGFKPHAINAHREAHRTIWRSDLPRSEALDRLEERLGEFEEIQYLVEFLRASEGGRMGRALEAFRPAPLYPEENGTEE